MESFGSRAVWDLYYHRYEQDEAEILRRYLARDDRVLELGTGLGFLAVMASKICQCGSVTTLEANPCMHETIMDVFKRNGVKPLLLRAGVGRRTIAASLIAKENFYGTQVSSLDPLHGMPNGSDEHRCQLIGFEELLAEFQPSFVIVDIEGSEYDLVGCHIERTVRRILMETHPPPP